ncbi:MAG: SAV_2336 N-terminal domain-related protein [Cyanobacteriota bacterium]|nr:SAV_2336 N-terminal domain-related protein [Cyanobacteriota bacterium]
MIDKLITALSKEMEMSTEEIADTIWLALQIQESQSESVSSYFSLVKEDMGANENKIAPPELQPQTSDSNETGKNQDLESQKAKIYPQSQQQTESLDLSFKTPNAPSLRQPLTLARALKPLMRPIPAGTNFILDETATIERIANTRLWLPVLRPTLEPWLDLELVVDESISMQFWRQTIRDLEKLLKNYGIFRDVRIWGMTAKDGEKVQVRRGIGAAAKNKFPRSSKELIDGSGHRLILVVSDCVSSYWRDGKVTKALEIWGNSVPTAIIQMLPKWLWKRTALGRASEVRLRALTPGMSNQNLIAQEVSLWEELEEKKGIKVPIFTLEEDKATTWAQMLSGKSSVSTLGFVFKLDAPVKENRLFNLDYSRLSPEDRVQAFRVTASPMARKLAGLLAAAPVICLPVVRLIRGALLRESLQVNVAEVFLGGLLKPLSEIKVETHPDDVLYGFVDGVRELLIDSMPSEWVLQVVDKVSEYVAERVGLSLEDFAAVLRREKKVEDSGVIEEVGYFATVTAQVLRRLGGEYVKVAEELEDNLVGGIAHNKITTEFEQNRHFIGEENNTIIYSFCTDKPWNLPFDALVIPMGYRMFIDNQLSMGGKFSNGFQNFLGENLILFEQATSQALGENQNKEQQISPDEPLLVPLPAEINRQLSLSNNYQINRFAIMTTVEDTEPNVSNVSKVINSIIALAQKQKLKSIVLPLPGTGILEFSVEQTVNKILPAMTQYLKNLPSNSIEEIIFVDKRESTIETINQVAYNFFVREDNKITAHINNLVLEVQKYPPNSLERRRTLNKLINAVNNSGKLFNISLSDQDILQETWLYIINKIDSFQLEKLDFISWINNILIRKSRDHQYRKYKNVNRQDSIEDVSLESINAAILNDNNLIDKYYLLREFIEEDPEGILTSISIKSDSKVNFRAILLKRIEGQSFQEIAEYFNLNSYQIVRFYNRCMKEVKPILEKYLEI